MPIYGLYPIPNLYLPRQLLTRKYDRRSTSSWLGVILWSREPFGDYL